MTAVGSAAAQACTPPPPPPPHTHTHTTSSLRTHASTHVVVVVGSMSPGMRKLLGGRNDSGVSSTNATEPTPASTMFLATSAARPVQPTMTTRALLSLQEGTEGWMLAVAPAAKQHPPRRPRRAHRFCVSRPQTRSWRSYTAASSSLSSAMAGAAWERGGWVRGGRPGWLEDAEWRQQASRWQDRSVDQAQVRAALCTPCPPAHSGPILIGLPLSRCRRFQAACTGTRQQ